jgi:hypothetical protein
MTANESQDLRDEIRKVGGKVDTLAAMHEDDRKFLQSLHADHLRLETRVRMSEERIQSTQSDLNKHIEVACVIQESTRKDVAETKEMMKSHIAQEETDRREIIRYLRDQNVHAEQDGKKVLMWAVGLGVSIVITLFGLLWATGAVGK